MSTDQHHRHHSVLNNPLDTTSTVIIGAGIIGCATAYYLSQSPATRTDTIHLVEASPELFASASGKSGGFLASDWFGPATASLGELSFKLHKELANGHNGHRRWGYSRSTGRSLVKGQPVDGARGEDWLMQNRSRATAAGVHEFNGPDDGPACLTRESGDQVQTISGNNTVGQVDPLRLSQFLLRESILSGVRLHQPATAVRLSKDDDGNLSGVRISQATGSEHKLPCTRLLIAAGAWTGRVFETLFPNSPLDLGISQLAGHSIVVKSPRWTEAHESQGCHAIFTTLPTGVSPEIFTRIGGEIYVAGLNDPSLALPELPTDAKIDAASIEKLKQVSQNLMGKGSTDVSDLEVLREGLCFRPITRSGNPIISRVSDEQLGTDIHTQGGAEGGVYVAAGHGPWGISHSLGTGKVMAEMIEGQATSANVAGLRI